MTTIAQVPPPRHLAQQRTVAIGVPASTDLPATIGKPATRALLGAGITSLAEVAEHSQAELRGSRPSALQLDSDRWKNQPDESYLRSLRTMSAAR